MDGESVNRIAGSIVLSISLANVLAFFWAVTVHKDSNDVVALISAICAATSFGMGLYLFTKEKP